MTMEEDLVVLVVEDEPLVRMYAVDVLEDAGLTVVEAATADEALGILEERTDIAILFTDVKMPGSLDGFGLARVVHERWPKIMILITSGHFRPDENRVVAPGSFIPKPYPPAKVVATIRDLADRARA